MSGDWITVRGDDGRPKRVVDTPDLCGKGHPTVAAQEANCPACHAPNITVFWCRTAGCRWTAPGGRHAEHDCKPGAHKPPIDPYWQQR